MRTHHQSASAYAVRMRTLEINKNLYGCLPGLAVWQGKASNAAYTASETKSLLIKAVEKVEKLKSVLGMLPCRKPSKLQKIKDRGHASAAVRIVAIK